MTSAFRQAFWGVIWCLHPAEWEARLQPSFREMFVFFWNADRFTASEPPLLLSSSAGWTWGCFSLGERCFLKEPIDRRKTERQGKQNTVHTVSSSVEDLGWSSGRNIIFIFMFLMQYDHLRK